MNNLTIPDDEGNRSEKQPQSPANPREQAMLLGLSVDELAGINVEDLKENETAIKMMLHYYRELVDENRGLRNELNTLRTYVDAFNRKELNTSIGTPLLVTSNIFIGFGVNLITSGALSTPIVYSIVWAGIGLFIPGLTMTIVGLYFTMIKDKRQ